MASSISLPYISPISPLYLPYICLYLQSGQLNLQAEMDRAVGGGRHDKRHGEVDRATAGVYGGLG